MPKITQFDKPSLHLLRAALDRAMAQVALDHGLTLRVGNISYQQQTCTLKVEAAIVDQASGRPATKEAEAFKQLASIYGLRPEDLGRTVTHQGQPLTVAGLKTGASKRPILLEGADGRRIVAPVELVKQLLAR
jgi:hypothetical protein